VPKNASPSASGADPAGELTTLPIPLAVIRASCLRATRDWSFGPSALAVAPSLERSICSRLSCFYIVVAWLSTGIFL